MKTVNRRRVLQGMLVLPAVLALPKFVQAADKAAPAAPANLLPESDPMGNALKYKHDANTADATFRKDKTAFCSNCSKFNKCATGDTACKPGDKKAAYGPCELFSGKVVASKGWCMSWAKA
ncbi:MAG: high-potential iron-sulfur protein [Bdellovibrionales bacterium]|nr:high-potential iron-sulfur protein [Bdellovibrionales bacterium]